MRRAAGALPECVTGCWQRHISWGVLRGQAWGLSVTWFDDAEMRVGKTSWGR